jgi:hypothetical protein
VGYGREMASLDPLTILRLLTRGLTMKEIAGELGVAPWQVRERLEQERRQLRARTVLELVWLRRHDLGAGRRKRAGRSEYLKQWRRKRAAEKGGPCNG